MTAQHRTIAIIAVWVESLGALSLMMLNNVFQATNVTLMTAALLIMAASAVTYFIVRVPAPTA